MKIIFIGPPGSGKSTQGKLLAQLLLLPFVSLGDVLRTVSQEKTPQGAQMRSIMNRGDLLPNDMALAILQTYLQRDEFSQGYILDGFPRTLDQAQQWKEDIDMAIHVKLDDQEALNRIRGRTDIRDDQSEETVVHRLRVYHTETDSVILYYASLDKLVEVDGRPSIENIHAEIRKQLRI